MKYSLTLALLLFTCTVFFGRMLISSSFFTTSGVSEPNSFRTTQWESAVTAVTLLKSSGTLYFSHESVQRLAQEDPQNNLEFHLVFEKQKPQFLSFEYRITSQETAQEFDTPVVWVTVGEKTIAQIIEPLEPTQPESIWKTASIDLSTIELENGTYTLEFKTNNTYDELFAPNLELQQVTTTKFFVQPQDQLLFNTSKKVATVFLSNSTTTQELPVTNSAQRTQFYFTIPDDFPTQLAEISFWSLDLYEHTEQPNYQELLFTQNNAAPSLSLLETNSELFFETESEVSVAVNIPQLPQGTYFFEARTSHSPILSQEEWNSAEKKASLEHALWQNMLAMIIGSGQHARTLVYRDITQGSYLALKLCTAQQACTLVLHEQLQE